MVFPLLKKVCIRRRERKKRGKKEKKKRIKKKRKTEDDLDGKKIFKKKKIYCGRGENPITNCEEGPALGSRGRPREWGRGYIFIPSGDSPWTHLNCASCSLFPPLPVTLFGPAQG